MSLRVFALFGSNASISAREPFGMSTLTRQEAASEMVDGAIGAWLEGKHACAITLAGAAETGMPKIENQTPAFEVAVATIIKFGKCDRKQAVTIINSGRDWLKHYRSDRPDLINTDLTWAYVLRSYLHFRSVYPDSAETDNMGTLMGKIEEYLTPIRAAGKALMDGLQAFRKPVISPPPVSEAKLLK